MFFLRTKYAVEIETNFSHFVKLAIKTSESTAAPEGERTSIISKWKAITRLGFSPLYLVHVNQGLSKAFYNSWETWYSHCKSLG